MSKVSEWLKGNEGAIVITEVEIKAEIESDFMKEHGYCYTGETAAIYLTKFKRGDFYFVHGVKMREIEFTQMDGTIRFDRNLPLYDEAIRFVGVYDGKSKKFHPLVRRFNEPTIQDYVLSRLDDIKVASKEESAEFFGKWYEGINKELDIEENIMRAQTA